MSFDDGYGGHGDGYNNGGYVEYPDPNGEYYVPNGQVYDDGQPAYFGTEVVEYESGDNEDFEEEIDPNSPATYGEYSALAKTVAKLSDRIDAAEEALEVSEAKREKLRKIIKYMAITAVSGAAATAVWVPGAAIEAGMSVVNTVPTVNNPGGLRGAESYSKNKPKAVFMNFVYTPISNDIHAIILAKKGKDGLKDAYGTAQDIIKKQAGDAAKQQVNNLKKGLSSEAGKDIKNKVGSVFGGK